MAFAAFAIAVIGAAPASAASSRGTDFWLTFPGNLSAPELTLFISGEAATTGTVTIPGLAFSQTFTVTPGAVTSVSLPSGADLDTSDTVANLGIHVTAANAVTVYGLNRVQFTTDAYLGLPTDALGTDYINLGYKNTDVVNGTEFGIVATADNTVVTITPSVTTGARAAGTPYTINLNQGQTYQLRNTSPAPADLSGSIVSSTKPIALFGGHECANIPNGSTLACDHVVEELPPTTEWGKNFVSVPLATRKNGDTFRIMASTDNTTVNVNGATVTLNRGQIDERIIVGPSQISSDKPVLVMQYSNGTTFDGVTSDPFEMMIPPSEQFLASYTVSTPASGFSINYINVVAPAGDVGAVTLDGVPVAAGLFTPIGSSGFSGAQLPVSLGSHALGGPLPFGVSVYGFDHADSYGYPGGANFSQVASVASVALAPKAETDPVNSNHCVTATVTDTNAAAVVGVRVDFTVTGVNPSSGFAFTDSAGHAQYCYTGATPGDDTIKGAVGTLSDTATKHWTGGSTAHPTITTTPSASITVGGGISDGATLVGGNNPTGSVTFKLYGPGDPTCMTTLATLSGGLTANATANSGAFPTTAVGTYSWVASYAGDANNTGATSPCGSETVAVTQANPTLSTIASASVPAGGNISDTAKLSGGYAPTGSVTFSLYGPGDTACKTALTTRTGILSSGSAASGNVPTGAAGTYNWVASYPGDANNRAAVSGCGSEPVKVTPQTLTGRAYGLAAQATLLGLPTVNLLSIPDTGHVSTTVSSTTSTPCTAKVAGLVSATALCANVTTVAFPGSSTATASVASSNVGLTGIPAINIGAVQTSSATTCGGSSGATTIAYLAVGGTVVIAKPTKIAPNTRVSVGLVTLLLNEQTPITSPDKGLTVNGVHIQVNAGVGQVNAIVASSESDIGNCP